MNIRRIYKSIILLVILSCNSMMPLAQTVTGSLPPMARPERVIYDSAYISISYEYTHPNPSTGELIPTEVDVLTSQHYIGFYDSYKRLQIEMIDSLTLAGVSSQQAFPLLFALGNSKNEMSCALVLDLARDSAIIQIGDYATYQYSIPRPKLQWTAMPGDTTIAGVACKRAQTRYAGRTWTAWYATDEGYDLPIGPYLFFGLDGLVFEVADSTGHHRFALSKVERLTRPQPIYLPADSRVMKTTRDKARRAVENESQNPLRAMEQGLSTPMVMDEQTRNTLSRPNIYDPLELE